MVSRQEAIWVMGCYERDILRLFLIGAKNEIEAHRKGGIILRKRQNLWFDSLEEGAKYLEIYPPEQLHDKETTITMYEQRYYEEPY